MKFADLGLSDELMRAIDESGYDTPTPIQAGAIPSVLMMRDMIGIAQTGTGKTASFVLPMIDILAHGRARARMPRSLILEPTRELAAQVAENFEKYGKYHKLSMALLIGGVQMGDQVKALEKGVDVLIATPGRLMDLFERGKILLTGCNMLVIDEADRMLDMGFIPDIEKICKMLPPRRQTLLFSATMPKEIARLAKTFQKDPVRIEVARESKTAETIKQHVIMLPRGDDKAKRTALRRLVESLDVKNGIVFCNRKREVDIVAKSLEKHGFSAAPIHGDLPQSARMETLNRFRDGDLQLLVASDVAARGLDIPDVGHVFNYSPPPKDEDYVHRIGRTGRAGREGQSFTMVGPNDTKGWRGVMMLIKTDVEEYMPDGLLAELEDLPTDADGGRGRGRGRGERGGRRNEGRSEGRSEGRGRSRNRRDRPERTETAETLEETPAAAPEKPKRERSERPKRDYKRKDDDLILDPAPEDITGFGEEVPAFLKP